MTEVALFEDYGNDPKWGKASNRRGTHIQLAIAFVNRFPVGSTLSVEDFDQWTWDNGHLPMPSAHTPKKSNEWLAHLQRRHVLRHKINMAGAHPRLASIGSTPFIMEHIGNQKYEVRAPHMAIATNRIDPHLNRARKKVAYLMQSSDWQRLSDLDRKFAEEIFYETEEYVDEVTRKATALNAKFKRFENFLRSRVEQGLIAPVNGGIRHLLDHSADPSDDDPNE